MAAEGVRGFFPASWASPPCCRSRAHPRPSPSPASLVYPAQRRNGAGAEGRWGGVRGAGEPCVEDGGHGPSCVRWAWDVFRRRPVKCPWWVRRLADGVEAFPAGGRPEPRTLTYSRGAPGVEDRRPFAESDPELVPSLSRATPRPWALCGARGRLPWAGHRSYPSRGARPAGRPRVCNVWTGEGYGRRGGVEAPSFPPPSDLSCVSAEGLAERGREPCRAAAAGTACR